MRPPAAPPARTSRPAAQAAGDNVEDQITNAIAASITISLGIGHRSGRLQFDDLSLIDMVTVLQVRYAKAVDWSPWEIR